MDQFDNDFNDYVKKLERRMWKSLGYIFIIGITALFIALICYK